MSLDDAPILDPAVLDELRAQTGDDEAFILELVEAYVTEAGGHVEALSAAAAAGDAAAAVRPAHTLKSSSASLGAMRLSVLCRGIEEGTRAGHAERLADDAALVVSTWAATLDALRAAGLTA